jgi:hypothetical protein
VEDADSASFREIVYSPMRQKQVKTLVDIKLRGWSPMRQRLVIVSRRTTHGPRGVKFRRKAAHGVFQRIVESPDGRRGVDRALALYLISDAAYNHVEAMLACLYCFATARSPPRCPEGA